MPKVDLTKELGQTIRNTRIQHDVKSIELAKMLNKSVAYVTKLENGDLKQIDYDLLIQIFEFLLPKDENFNDFISKVLEKCQFELTEEEIDEQLWFNKFDMELRRIPIPNSLIDFIKSKLEELKINSTEVIIHLNKNEEIKDLNIDFDKYKKNTYIIEKTKDKIREFIIFDLKESLIDSIITREIKDINYISMVGILKSIFELQDFISSTDAKEKATAILKEHKFYTFKEKKELIKQNQHSGALQDILNEYDKANISYINDIFKHFKMLSDWRIEYTNTKLEALTKSFDIDPPFILAVIGQDFFKLDKLKKEDKKRFLDKLNELVDNFSKIEYEDKEDYTEY